ncbi:hypothetical protein BS47DRAFT_1296180, partial [Hydnum rufescens UP504]
SCNLCEVLLSYDIFCQWTKKQWVCHTKLPLTLQLDSKTELTGVIPKFHLPAHKQQCHMKYSLNLHPGAGCTDGEGIERDWANINPVAMSTKEMGEGLQHDTIDDLFGDWNFCKVLGLGKSLSCINNRHNEVTLILKVSLCTSNLLLPLQQQLSIPINFSSSMLVFPRL